MKEVCMQKIFKYPLEVTDNQIVDILLPAILLSVENQRGNIVLYAIVDDESNVTIPIDVAIVGTGNVICQNLSTYKFMGTVKMAEGALVWHIFAKHSSDFIDVRGAITEPRLIEA